jgi:isopentenyldiphosphate isomerase
MSNKNMSTKDKTEILDVIDENDNVIGTATREQCHTDPKLLHHTVHFTFIDRKNSKILLTQRSFKKKHT